MKYLLINKDSGDFGLNNPIDFRDLEKINDLEVPKSENLSPVSLGDGTADWKPLAPRRLKEVLVQKKEQLLQPLESDILYVIDGDIALFTGEYITVPESGLNIMGYSFDASRIGAYGADNHDIFVSPIGGSGNLVIHNIAFTTTGQNSRVFNIKDKNGSHALEMVTVNFEGCTSIGLIDGYRQGTGITIGFYGCKAGLTFSGAWNGFKLTNTNAFGFGANSSMFKRGDNLTFRNRFYLEVNVDLPVTSALCDFGRENFLDKELLQVNTTLAKSGGILSDSNTPLLFPNIHPEDPEALFTDNIGLVNSFDKPYGIKSDRLIVAINDTEATGAGINPKEVYVEGETGYFKVAGQGDGYRSVIPQHVRDITEEEKHLWNNPETHKVRTYVLFEEDLTSTDELGVLEYLNLNGITVNQNETVIIKISEIKYVVTIITPKEGQLVTEGEDILIRIMFLQQIEIIEPLDSQQFIAEQDDVLIKVNIL